jgi:hypothetical protein
MRYLKALYKARSVRSAQRAAIRHHSIDRVRVLGMPKPSDVICIMVVRHEHMRLPDCLRHHRELGVGRFAIIDNGSTDGTREFLLSQPDVDLFLSLNKYSEARSGVYWHERLASHYGYGRWYLTVDADELLVYSEMDCHDLHDLAAFLTKWNSKVFFAPMIDMYSNLPLDGFCYEPGERMIDACRFFDGDSYTVTEQQRLIVSIKGGPRSRKLSSTAQSFKHMLEKFPFFYWDKTVRRSHIHDFRCFPKSAAPSGALLHFKFLPDFADKVAFAVESGEFWGDSIQYRRYQKSLENQEMASFYYAGSRAYDGPRSLVAAGLMNSINWQSEQPTRSVIKSKLFGKPLSVD